MSIVIIGLAKSVTEEEISKALTTIFPNLKFAGFEKIEDVPDNEPTINYIYRNTRSEFPIQIDIYFPLKYTCEREQYVAARLVSLLDCDTIVGYQPEGSHNPFLTLVYKQEGVFLGDDAETMYADEGEKEIQIIEPFVTNYSLLFDQNGEL